MVGVLTLGLGAGLAAAVLLTAPVYNPALLPRASQVSSAVRDSVQTA